MIFRPLDAASPLETSRLAANGYETCGVTTKYAMQRITITPTISRTIVPSENFVDGASDTTHLLVE
jgi:hypothetical protein